MAFLTAVLYLGFACISQGLPTWPDRVESRNPLFGSRVALNLPSLLDGNRHHRDMRYPLYMMQLYQNLVTGNDTGLANRPNTATKEYDTVLSLFAKKCTESENRWTLSFDMSAVSRSNELKLAELRILLPHTEPSHNITMDMYHSRDGEDNLYLGSFNANPPSTKGSPWKVFNVTKILQPYFKERRDIDSEHLKAKERAERGSGMSNAEFIDAPGPSQQYNPHQTSVPTYLNTKGVMLVLFTKVKSSANHIGFPSLIKTAESSKYVDIEKASRVPGIRRHRRNRNENHHLSIGSIPSRHVENGKPLCRRVDMIVDFEDIGWSSWIVYPKKYNAYRCEGACPIPLNETFKPTNHAYMKSVVKLYQPERVECPLCVPVKMSPLSMLYYEGDEVVLRHHQEMIVEECGCS
ncbi:nodal homolog precursor [Xenopus laevis]|uniref:Nodal homolog n=2 Tax=Xenopus laevis TaxID=8355 RepID=NODAL_XENLA|nr:nodal homolog precursor [Xenopus laevis]Q91619.1 RecName: Full=Nodal homolog; AltName: Full=Nodal-related protein 1; AltName: Full=Xnr-1; Short=Xnr1; Short=nr-1; Flags: Precursor [Xenopus laevis]AAA97392.1 Xnr-1 [Xenopus laevis]OCT90259.1 hypothetical protein XELAEV_18018871mg [Xenopus laevis]